MRSPHSAQRDALTLTPEMAAAAARLRIDALAIEVISAFSHQEIEAILLKGPVVARWLYDPAEHRRYVDVDLLIEPARADEASKVLQQLGFDAPPGELPGNKPRNASGFVRSNGAAVDLHHALFGVGLAPSRAWPILWRHTKPFDLHGTSVRTLDESARAFHVALHAAQSGPAREQSVDDLSLALERVPFSVWSEAARLAVELQATPGFATGLSLLPKGGALARRLGIAGSRSVESELTSSSLRDHELSFAMGFEWLAGREGLAAKLRYVMTKFFPPRAWIREWSPFARRSPLHLVAAYLWRWMWLARHLPAGYRAWRRARKEVKRSPS